VLIELGVVEQRHKAVLEVMDGLPVTEVALRYGVTRQTVHRWLRWYATQLLRAGVNAEVVSERLGHANVSITLNTYAHVLPAMKQSPVDALDWLNVPR